MVNGRTPQRGGQPRCNRLTKTNGFMTTADPEISTGSSTAWVDQQASPGEVRGPAAVCVGGAFFKMRRRLGEALLCWNSSYRLSALVGVLTYVAYGSLNDAWTKPALTAVSVYMFLSIPLYSKLSNWMEHSATKLTRLGTGGRLARYCLQLLVNLALLWVFVAGQVVSLSGLDPIGGFFATAAWITLVSQGGQYLANWLAQRGVGEADRNVVLAVSVSATVNALAVSGVGWIQPVYVALSLGFGAAILGMGLVMDARFVFTRSKALTPQQ